MRTCAVVLTYRAISTGREELLAETVRSLKAEADAVYVVDNGSDDGSDRMVRSEYGGLTHGHPLHTSGYGTNLCARVAAGDGSHLVVLSDDDMHWRPGWRATLESWWRFAPEDVALTGGHVEPLFPWNDCLGRVEFGEVPGLERTSTGAASWTYLADRFGAIFSPRGIPQQVQGHGDVPACERLLERGYRICQVDVAEHRGHGKSTWGNATVAKYGWDVEPAMAILRGAS